MLAHLRQRGTATLDDDTSADVRARVIDSIAEIAPAPWDALVPDGQPFTRHAFLRLLESSGSANARAGWRPLHLLLERGDRLVGAVPLYAKSHSWGEYVFDQGWADAYQRAGGSYYPKLLAAVPFTPVPGARLLAKDVADRPLLAAALTATLQQLELSTLHVTFPSPDEAELLDDSGFLLRRGIQYHWRNRGYRDFADFLDNLRSDKRKTIRKERAAVAKAGVVVETLTGSDAAAAVEAFYPFYLGTVDKRWGSAYLTKAFFRGLARELADHVVFVRASKDGKMVAGALNLRGDDCLYGRLWGAVEGYNFLHFECCYYAALDYAIAHGLPRVEAGAQGTHKLLRGYEPVWTWSAHLIRDRALRDAIARFLRQETAALELKMDELKTLAPYREARPGR